MKPLAEFPPPAAKQVRFVLCDIDDTLTDHGRLSALAYGALEQLRNSGLKVVPVTGRPAGWCDLIARQWPVDGVVGENGAFYFYYEENKRCMRRRYWHDAETRRQHRSALEAAAARILREVPGSAVAADQAYRESDLAIDYCEDVPPLDEQSVRRIVAIFQEEGVTAKISSIHVNGWFGDHDKSSMSKVMLKDVFGYDMTERSEHSLFVGDSPNDCPMFESVGHSVGVANIQDFTGGLATPPKWIARRRGGAGFAEIADYLIAAREGI